MWFMDEKNILSPIMKDVPECYNMTRQKLPKVYYQNACIDVFRTTDGTEKNLMTGEVIAGNKMDENYEIDTEEDHLKAAEKLKDDLEKI